MVDGLQAGGQLHDDRPDGGLRQQWSIARSLHVTLMTAKIIYKLVERSPKSWLKINPPEGAGLALEWISVPVGLWRRCEVFGQ